MKEPRFDKAITPEMNFQFSGAENIEELFDFFRRAGLEKFKDSHGNEISVHEMRERITRARNIALALRKVDEEMVGTQGVTGEKGLRAKVLELIKKELAA